jgi:hypothetical protein
MAFVCCSMYTSLLLIVPNNSLRACIDILFVWKEINARNYSMYILRQTTWLGCTADGAKNKGHGRPGVYPLPPSCLAPISTDCFSH